MSKHALKPGDRVIKNPETWKPSEFDSWGAGIGVGTVVEPPFWLEDDTIDVVWPKGRCFQEVAELLPGPPPTLANQLVESGLCSDRPEARRMIVQGEVKVDYVPAVEGQVFATLWPTEGMALVAGYRRSIWSRGRWLPVQVARS